IEAYQSPSTSHRITGPLSRCPVSAPVRGSGGDNHSVRLARAQTEGPGARAPARTQVTGVALDGCMAMMRRSASSRDVSGAYPMVWRSLVTSGTRRRMSSYPPLYAWSYGTYTISEPLPVNSITRLA